MPGTTSTTAASGIAMLLAALVAALPASAEMTVVEHAFANAVVTRDAVGRYDGSAPRRQPLFFWTRLRGDPAALATLRARGQLPIRHEWVHYVGPDPDISTLRPTDAISVGGAREAVVDALASEVAVRGYFDWRTWSFKRNLAAGKHVVRVVYADDSPVMCASGDGGGTRPCVFRIDVSDTGR